MAFRPRAAFVLVALIAWSSGCSSSVNQPPIPTYPSLQLTLPGGGSSLALTAGSTVTVTVSESGYTGAFNASSSNASVATISPASLQPSARARRVNAAASGGGTFTITAVGPGSTTMTIRDWHSSTGTFTVTVASASPSASPTPSPSPTASPTPSATPGAITLTPSSISFTAAGTAYAQSIGAAQANYSGTFTASTTTCGGIATISPSSGTSFTITPVAAGHCTFSIAGGGGIASVLTIDVTTTTVGGS